MSEFAVGDTLEAELLKLAAQLSDVHVVHALYGIKPNYVV